LRELERAGQITADKNPLFSTAPLLGAARGQMFGLLLCEDRAGNPVVLKAFSGQYNGQWRADGWAPPLFDPEQFDQLSAPIDRQIKEIEQHLQGLETSHPRHRELVQQRKALSQALMKQLHGLYHLTNFRGQTRPLTALFQGGIPTGAGDCCAPKLLNLAAVRGLRPRGLSEFYFGRANPSGTRQHGQFYPACTAKCRPLLGFMLCGIETPPANLATQRPSQFEPRSGEFAKIRESENRPDIEIVYSEAEFVVVNKPSGLLSVPGRGTKHRDCVVARIRALYPDCMEQPAVHRLDQDTSGLMVLARTAETHRALSLQFHNRLVEKNYIARLEGDPPGQEGRLELPFRLDPNHRPRQIYDPVHGKPGITFWKKLSVENGQARIEFRPVTGRTHQLRLHAASEHGLGIPILGDRLYGSGAAPGQLKLHASFLSFTHPHTGERLEFSSAPPF
jgi:tRNA pseudouridine32 synthase/23S rRNA pseudouridine746 synthase